MQTHYSYTANALLTIITCLSFWGSAQAMSARVNASQLSPTSATTELHYPTSSIMHTASTIPLLHFTTTAPSSSSNIVTSSIMHTASTIPLLHFTTTAPSSSSNIVTEQSLTIIYPTLTTAAPTLQVSTSVQSVQSKPSTQQLPSTTTAPALQVSTPVQSVQSTPSTQQLPSTTSQLLQHPTQTPVLAAPQHSQTIIFGLAGVIVGQGLITILLVLALILVLINNHKLKKLVAASKASLTYAVPSTTMSVSSVSTPSNKSISKDSAFNQGYDRLLLKNHNSRTSSPRRMPFDYELPVISNIATNSHTALNVSTESLNNDRNYGYGSLAFHKLHTTRATPQDYEVPVISNIAALNANRRSVSSESINNDLAMSGTYDTVLLSPLPSGVYDYISQSTDDVTMVIDLPSESERLRHASTRTYEEVEIYNDIAQTEK